MPVPAAEIQVDALVVRRLLQAQHPDLAEMPLRWIGTGWDTVVYRLGSDLTVRVPRRELGARLVAKEVRWLPGLAALVLPMPVPEPVRVGVPSPDFRWPWSVCRYVPGRPVGSRGLAGEPPARQLAGFLRALHTPAPAEAPSNPWRGVPLAQRDSSVRDALRAVPQPERSALTELWEQSLTVGGHQGPPLWLHGDLHGLNVLSLRRRITGVVDFGDVCAGDPATDLAGAWMVLDARGREAFRQIYGGPDDRWQRGRGWAAFFAIVFLAHSHQAPENAAIGRRTLAALEAEGS